MKAKRSWGPLVFVLIKELLINTLLHADYIIIMIGFVHIGPILGENYLIAINQNLQRLGSSKVVLYQVISQVPRAEGRQSRLVSACIPDLCAPCMSIGLQMVPWP